ncbi:MAG: MFS transporter [Phenylobacterium sp.]
MTEAAAATGEEPEVLLEPDAQPLPAARRMRLLLYAGVPILIVNFAAPYWGVLLLPITFFLKNRLHLTPNETAHFNLIVAIPLFVSSLAGFVRDRWSPFGAGDRGHLVVFGLATAAVYAVLAFMQPTYALLLGGVLLVTTLMQFVAGAAAGLSTGVGRHHAMTGQMSTIQNIATLAPTVFAALAGGILSGFLEGGAATTAARTLFLLGGGLMLLLAAFGAFGPRRLFDDAKSGSPPPTLTPAGDILRLLKTYAIYPVLLIQLLWQFAPGANLALQYHLANEFHASDAQVGEFFAIFYATFIPVFLLYGWLAQRFRLGTLLWIGAILAVPQMAGLLFIRSTSDALLAAASMGLLGGIGQAAFTDLAMRSCPKGLEGAMMMLFLSLFWVSSRLGDLWGADLYQNHGGYNVALWATIAVYAAILLVVPFVPRRIKATIDA